MFFGFRSEEGVKSFEDGEGGAVKNFGTGDLPIWGGGGGGGYFCWRGVSTPLSAMFLRYVSDLGPVTTCNINTKTATGNICSVERLLLNTFT